MSGKLHSKLPLTAVPLIHGNLSRVSRGTVFLLYLSLLKELKSSRIESHVVCRNPEYGRANSKKSFIQSVLRFGKALEFE